MACPRRARLYGQLKPYPALFENRPSPPLKEGDRRMVHPELAEARVTTTGTLAKPRFFYPYCAVRLGWCLKISACRKLETVSLTSPSAVPLPPCWAFRKKHPKTHQKPHLIQPNLPKKSNENSSKISANSDTNSNENDYNSTPNSTPNSAKKSTQNPLKKPAQKTVYTPQWPPQWASPSEWIQPPM